MCSDASHGVKMGVSNDGGGGGGSSISGGGGNKDIAVLDIGPAKRRVGTMIARTNAGQV